VIVSRTPLRISFAGGGTDLKAFYEIEPGAVVGTTINKYIYIMVNKPLDEAIKIGYWKTEIVDSVQNIEHAIVREALKHAGLSSNIEVACVSDVPPGTGLGSSGSFTVGLLHALYAHKSAPISKEELAKEACFIEIDLLGSPVGKQDQYIAASGGLQYVQFNPDETVGREPIACSDDTRRKLDENLMLFYTGQSRSAYSILLKQRAKTKNRDEFQVLKELKGIAQKMRQLLLGNGDLKEFGELLHEEWTHKKRLVDGISNEGIDRYYDKALAAGATGGKISGAGGGGFLLLYCEKDNQEKVREALADLKEVAFSFETTGTTVIDLNSY
jgi:D-glycero-alpha-D-manno-heptose-7-phosphate kinase